MELLAKAPIPFGKPLPLFRLQVDYYADHAEIRGIPANPVQLLDVVRMITGEYTRLLKEQQHQAKGGLVLPVAPIRNGPVNGQ